MGNTICAGNADLSERFWSKVRLGPDCWNWTASVNNRGYGRFYEKANRTSAHVVAYRMAFGEVPAGKEVHHICENRRCVRPTHLQAVTHRENLLASDTLPGINARKTVCNRGHDLALAHVDRLGKRHCLACRRDRRRAARAGQIGEPQREYEFEPFPDAVPVTEPAAPEREPETVPA